MISPIIVIPMAGASSRFFNAGYTVPKYMLPLGEETLFEKSVKTFEKYFTTATFLFIIRTDQNALIFINDKIKDLGILDYKICQLDNITKGQAETVRVGLQTLSGKQLYRPLYIFNIDTIRKNLVIPDIPYDGYFDVFVDENADESKWSFCELDPTNQYIVRTAEKEKISNLCSTGLYIFKSCELYMLLYKRAVFDVTQDYNYYVAPLYNYFTTKEHVYPLYCPPEDIEFSGVPDEYEILKIKYKTKEEMN